MKTFILEAGDIIDLFVEKYCCVGQYKIKLKIKGNIFDNNIKFIFEVKEKQDERINR
jgi:hypothetical protein